MLNMVLFCNIHYNSNYIKASFHMKQIVKTGKDIRTDTLEYIFLYCFGYLYYVKLYMDRSEAY